MSDQIKIVDPNFEDHRFTIGENFLISCPPGWLMVGRVKNVYKTHVEFEPAAFIETISSGKSAFSLAEGHKNVVSSSWPIASMCMQKSYIGFTMPVPKSVVDVLGHSAELEAIKGAK